MTELSMEQQFQLIKLYREIDTLNLDRAKEMLKEAMRTMMVKDALTKDLMGNLLLRGLPDNA